LQPESKVLFLSLEQTRGDWWDRARRIYRFYNEGTTDADAADYWRQRIWLDDRNRVNEEQLRAVLDDFVYEVGHPPHLLAVDYLGYFARSFKGEPYQRTGDAVMALKSIAKEYRIPIIAPHQVSRSVKQGSAPHMDAARDSGVVEETADFVLSLWSEDTEHGRTLEDKTGKTHLRIEKSRHGGVGSDEILWFGLNNLVLISERVPEHAPGGTKAHQQRRTWAQDEVDYAKRYKHETWEHTLVRHMAKGLAYTHNNHAYKVEVGTAFEFVRRALFNSKQVQQDLELEIGML
jgi:hypothetical protein